MADVHTRQIDAGESALLREIRIAAITDAPEMFAQTLREALLLTEQDWRDRAERYAAGSIGVCYLAEHAGATVGMSYGFLDERQDDVARVGGMWVAPHARRLGIGVALVSRVRSWAIERGRAELRLHVFHAGTGAQQFYRSQGFAVVDPVPDAEGFVELGVRLEMASERDPRS